MRRHCFFLKVDLQPRIPAGKIILVALPSLKLRKEPSWGKINSGEDIGEVEAGKKGKTPSVSEPSKAGNMRVTKASHLAFAFRERCATAMIVTTTSLSISNAYISRSFFFMHHDVVY